MDNNKHDAKRPESQDETTPVPATLNVDEPQIAPSIDTSADAQAAAPTVNKVNSSSARVDRSSWSIRLGVLLSLGLTLCAIGGGFVVYQKVQQDWQNQLQVQATKNHALELQLQQALLQPNQRIEQLEQQQLAAAKTQQTLAELAKQQAEQADRLNRLAQRSPTHWMASEAEYLVNMAGRKLWLEKDPRTAVDLLKSADETIAGMNNPALLPIRKALAQDIAATSNIKTTDIEGSILALDSLIEQIKDLPLNRAEGQVTADTESKISSDVNDWQSNLGKTWKALTEDFITIRHRSADSPALLAPEQQWYLVENIRHKLLQAQSALYRYDRASYHQSLMLARKWINANFDVSHQDTAQAIASIDELATLTLDPIKLHSFAAKPLLLQLTSYGELSLPEDAPL